MNYTVISMTAENIFAKRRAYAAKFAGISFWTNVTLSYLILAYLKFFDPELTQRIHLEVSMRLPPVFTEKCRVLEAFDGFSHVSFVVATVVQIFFLLPMTMLFISMHLRAQPNERLEYFFTSTSNLLVACGVFSIGIYVFYIDSLTYDATVKAIYLTIWPLFPAVSALLNVVFQYFCASIILTAFGQAKIGVEP